MFCLQALLQRHSGRDGASLLEDLSHAQSSGGGSTEEVVDFFYEKGYH